MADIMKHIDEGTIHSWIDGALAPDEARRVEEHVALCDSCSRSVAEARGLVAASSRILSALDSVPRGVIPGHAADGRSLAALRARARRRGTRWWARRQFLAAASLLIVAGSAAVVWQSGRSDLPSVAPGAGRSVAAEPSQSAQARGVADAGAATQPSAVREVEGQKPVDQVTAARASQPRPDNRLATSTQVATEKKSVADSIVSQSEAVSDARATPRSVLSRAAEAARAQEPPAVPALRSPAAQGALATPADLAGAAGRASLGASVLAAAESARRPDMDLLRRRSLESPTPALPIGCYELSDTGPAGGRLLGVPRSIRLLESAAPRGADSSWMRAVDQDQGRDIAGVAWRMLDAATVELLVLHPLDSTVVRFRPAPAGTSPPVGPRGVIVAVANRVICR